MTTPDWKKTIVRIRNQSGNVVGAGFFATQDLIVTCAHVVEEALKKSDQSKYLGQTLELDLAFVRDVNPVHAEIITWKQDSSEINDLAVLRLKNRYGFNIRTAPLSMSEVTRGLECEAYGFPKKDDDGLTAITTVVATTSEGLIQLESTKAIGQIVEKGYSGTPIWSHQENAIIGMVVSAVSKNSVSLGIPSIIIDNLIKSIHSNNTLPTHNISEKRIDSLIRLIRESPDPVLFLGAGVSHKSGIPLTDDLVAKAVHEAFGREHNRHRDPTIRRSDWLEWLEKQAWYDRHRTLSDQYVAIMKNLFRDEDRVVFLRQMCQPDVEPGIDYRNIVHLLSEQRISTIFTTNFDDVLSTVLRQVSNPPTYNVAGPHKPYGYDLISTVPRYPQIIQLFGNYEYYATAYFSEEHRQLNPNLGKIRNQIVAFLRDHPIIVVGYSGKEASIINDLFLANLEDTNHFQNGLYWCIWERDNYLHPNVINLANSVGNNFFTITIPSNEYLTEVFVKATNNLPIKELDLPEPTGEPVTEDMRVVPGISIDDLNWEEVKARIPEYCRKMKIQVPSIVSDDWLIEILTNEDFIRVVDGKLCLTIAGYLLFGDNKVIKEKHSAICIELKVGSEEPVIFRGNLWNLLKLVNTLETEFNQPYRLKGLQSETVTPYPPLALKELVVNALVHRKYFSDNAQGSAHIVISVEGNSITINSPGGLLQTIYQQLPDDETPESYLGYRVLKGYRNPVIAHFLYSTGDMDRLGSGLVDVRKWVRQNNGAVTFRIANDFFEVTIYRRADTIDTTTGTANSSIPETRFVSNLFEVSHLPDTIWSANTEYRYVPKILQKLDGRLPSFVLYDGRLFTFSNLELEQNPLNQFIERNTVQVESISEFSASEVGQRRLVNLLNQALSFFIESNTELWFDWKRKRAYFTRDGNSEEKKISYQGRVRRAERTVVKARKSTNNNISYWEHRAVEFYFKKFGNMWAVQLLPTYVFTTNGYKDFLPGERSGPMATRKLSREYNAHVDNDLTFWSRYLSTGDTEINIENSYGCHITLRNTPADIVLKGSPLGIESEHENQISPELSELEEDLEEQLFAEEFIEGEDESND